MDKAGTEQDRELAIAIELSRKTFMEEQSKREAESTDLMCIEDPAVLQRNRQIEEIKQMLKNTANAVNSPFMPLALANFASSSSMTNFVQPQIMAAPFGQQSAVNFAQHHFCLPSTSSAPQFEYSNVSFTPLPPTPAPSTCSKSSSGQQISELNFQPPSFPQNATNSQNQQLVVQTNLNPFKQNVNLASPLKVPFRHGGDLIDLNSPRNVRSMALEEFDPLYHKLKRLEAIEKQSEPTNLPSCSQQECNAAQPEEAASNRQKSPPSCDDSAGKPKPKPRMTRPKMQHRLLTCNDLEAIRELSCDFYKEKQLLSEQCSRLAIAPGTKQNVFFLSPVLDYFVTDVDTIKLRVHQDDTWPRDTPEEPKQLEMACGVRNTSEEILVDVLLRLLPQEEIARNQGQIPLDEYALKVFGTDEFLVRDASIGKHPFVADYLAKGKDVELEVGKCRLPLTPMPGRLLKRSATAYPIVNEDVFDTFVQTLKGHVEKCLASPEDRRLRQPVLQSIKMITTYMHNTQPGDLVAALDSLCLAASADSLHEAINFIVAALIRLFRAYCSSTLTDFSVRDPLEDNKSIGEICDSAGCNEKLLLSVESAHNLPMLWSSKYKTFLLEAHLMYGPKSFGMCASNARHMVSKHSFNFVPIQLWVDFDVHISALPRESQVCFILRGVPILEEAANGQADSHANNNGGSTAASSGYASARNSANNESGIFAHQLATASVPLYNVEGFLLQGPLLLPLHQMEDEIVQPWGPRPLIRQPEDVILVVKALEFEYGVQFPQEISLSEVHWREFDSLQAEEQENLQTLVDSAVSHQLTDDDREFLWSNRHCLYQFPHALPLVLSSSFSWGTYSLANIYALLQKWCTLSPMVAMELLLPYFQDKMVREKALKCIGMASSEFLFNLITQFVEALRYETYENSSLAVFLLEQSTKDRRFAFELYWQLQHRIQDGKSPSFASRCQLLQQQLLELNIPGFENEVTFQQLFLDRIDKISFAVKGVTESMMTKTLHKELYLLCDELDMRNIRIPIASSFRCEAISVPECSIFNSLTKPIKIMLTGKRRSLGVIYKAGDDLRQDAVVIQLVRAMNDIWLSEQLDLRMVLFKCLPTGSRKGLIELVPNCSTLREIIIQMGHGVAGVYKDDVLNNWLARQNPSEYEYKKALDNFRRSCAGWCVATYVLGIGDRHNDNILVTGTGHVFHIDFGKYMGDWQMAAGFKRDRVPFVFTPEMAFVINGGQSTTEQFQLFVDDCCKAFKLLRSNCSLVLNIMRFLSCSDIPGMSMDSVNFVENNLMLDMNDVQATVVFTRMIEESLQSRFPRLNFFAHTLAQFKGNPLQISGVTKVEDMNRLSFISEIYTEKSEGRVESVLVNSYEKWQENGKKIYMYKLLVKRLNENVNTQVYRSFQEFQELHWKLCYRFSSRAIPILTQTVTVGRTNIRAVAVRRQCELQHFLQRLFALSDEVAHTDLVYTFLHPLHRDTEPESRKMNGMPDIRMDQNAQCQVLLRLSLDQPRSELRVFVGHAKNLPLVGRGEAPDSYVKTYLRWGVAQQQKQWKRKTHVIKNAQNPTYNAEICYLLTNLHPLGTLSLSATELSHLSLDVAIWHAGNAVLKDNFPLCETRIHLNQLEECVPNKKGVKELECWFGLTPSYG